MIKENDTAFVDSRFKDDSPMATVAKIRQILKDNGLEVEEVWHDSTVPYCYSLSIKLLGTIFRVNGKGLTKEFALASGYGEFMERFQMGFINGPNVLKDGDFSIDDAKYEKRSTESLLQDDRHWYEKMSRNLHHFTGITMTPEQIVGQYADSEGNVSVTPFFDLTTATKAYLPTIMRKRVYATNGCAAGNTPEEAIVQAISEMVERSHQTRILEADLTLPDIPDEILRQYEAPYSIISYVRDHGYKVIVKDASLGTGFPVVCACIIDLKTGRYHTHFGAYPIFEIALSRSLTESFQGRSLRNIATFEDFSYRKTGEFSLTELSNELTMGTWIKRPSFFVGKPHRDFDPSVGLPGGNNRELLRQCIDYFKKQDLHILVRDRSCLGFPTYQVVIPGYSEAHVNRLSHRMDDHRYAPYATKVFRSPTTADTTDLLGLMMHLDQMKKFTANIRGVHGFLMNARLSAQLDDATQDRLMNATMGYAYYALGRKQDVIRYIDALIPSAAPQETGYLICLKRYLSLLTSGFTEAQAEQTIRFFHPEDVTQELLDCIHEGRNPLSRSVLHCDMTCQPDCPIYGNCYQKRVQELARLLDTKMSQLSFDQFSQTLSALL